MSKAELPFANNSGRITPPNPTPGPSTGSAVPSANHSHISSCTPISYPAAFSGFYRNGDTKDKAKATLIDNPYASEIGKDDFIRVFLPTLPSEIDVDKVYKTMKSRKVKKNLWTRFDKAPSVESEDSYFSHFERIFNSMADEACGQAKGKGPKPTFRYVATPNTTPITDGDNSKHRPDGLIVLSEHKKVKVPSYHHTALSAEFKKRKQNDEQCGVSCILSTGLVMLKS